MFTFAGVNSGELSGSALRDFYVASNISKVKTLCHHHQTLITRPKIAIGAIQRGLTETKETLNQTTREDVIYVAVKAVF